MMPSLILPLQSPASSNFVTSRFAFFLNRKYIDDLQTSCHWPLFRPWLDSRFVNGKFTFVRRWPDTHYPPCLSTAFCPKRSPCLGTTTSRKFLKALFVWWPSLALNCTSFCVQNVDLGGRVPCRGEAHGAQWPEICQTKLIRSRTHAILFDFANLKLNTAAAAAVGSKKLLKDYSVDR